MLSVLVGAHDTITHICTHTHTHSLSVCASYSLCGNRCLVAGINVVHDIQERLGVDKSFRR